MIEDKSVRLSLIDVMYGVVLGYGFNYYDQINSTMGYFRFFFAYTIVLIDWIYVHKLYWQWEYKNNIFFILDIIILFVFSTIIHDSILNNYNMQAWLSLLFVIYILWDFASIKYKLTKSYDLRFSLAGDFFAVSAFFAIWYLSKQILISALWGSILSAIIYSIACLSWTKSSLDQKKSE